MKPKMTEEVRAWHRAVSGLGGKARAKKYSTKTLGVWSAKGGKPRALKPRTERKLVKMAGDGASRRELARRFGVSLSTVARIVRRAREGG